MITVNKLTMFLGEFADFITQFLILLLSTGGSLYKCNNVSNFLRGVKISVIGVLVATSRFT